MKSIAESPRFNRVVAVSVILLIPIPSLYMLHKIKRRQPTSRPLFNVLLYLQAAISLTVLFFLLNWIGVFDANAT